jgi:CTP:molybdopterin cytidylyltransferase MocA
VKAISAVLLAGGASARHERNKLTLPLGDATVIQKSAGAFEALHLKEIVIVTGFYHDDIRSLTFGPRVRIVRNEDHGLGMSASVRFGLSALKEKIKGVFVCPADMPLIRSATLVSLLHSFDGEHAVVPRYGGKRGHPVLLSWKMATWCLDHTIDRVLPEVLDNFKTYVIEFDVDDEGVVVDLDRPEDYEACVSRWDRLNGKSGL